MDDTRFAVTERRSRIIGVLIGVFVFVVTAMAALAPLADAARPAPPAADPAIAYVTTGFATELRVMNADGSNTAVVYTSNGTIRDPSWSPDAGSIAFVVALTQAAGGFTVRRVDVDVVNGVPTGSDPVALASCQKACRYVAWSPLGNEIAYVDSPAYPAHYQEIRFVPATGGASQVFYSSSGSRFIGGVAWSPDGTQLAAIEDESSSPVVLLLDRATGAVTSVLLEGQFDILSRVDWSRPGRDALGLAGRTVDGTIGLFTVDLPSGTPVLVWLGRGLPIPQGPSWSPDNAKMVFAQGGTRAVNVLDLSSGSVQKIAGSSGTPQWPDWRR